MTTYKVLAVHGVGNQEASGSVWQASWASSIERSIRRHDPDAAVIVDFFDYDRRFAEADPDIGDYAEALLRLGGSALKHSILDALFGKRRGVSGKVDWTAGMVAQFAADSQLRKTLRADFARECAACFEGAEASVRVIAAHSLGSLLTYDTLIHSQAVGVGAHYLTFGSQIGHRGLRDIFNGRLMMPGQLAKWHHLYNPHDKVFTAPIALDETKFRQYDASFTVDRASQPGLSAHSAVLYFEDDGAVGAWASIAGRAPGSRSLNKSMMESNRRAMPAVSSVVRPARRKALLVGINEYLTPGNNLLGCVNDVYRMSEVLQELGFDVSDIRLLLDDRATSSAIRDRLDWLLRDAGDGAERVFFFSGHGVQVPAYGPTERVDHLDECLAPHDADFAREATLVRDDQIFELYSQLPYSAKVYFVFDCCHAGGMSRAGPASGSGSTRSRYLELPDDVRHRMLRWDGQRWVRRDLSSTFHDLARPQDRERLFGSGGAVHRFGRPLPLWHKLHKKPDAVRGNFGPFQPVLFYACQEHEEAQEYQHGSIHFGGFTYALTTSLRRLRPTSDASAPSFHDLLHATKQELAAIGIRQTPWIDGPAPTVGPKLSFPIFGTPPLPTRRSKKKSSRKQS